MSSESVLSGLPTFDWNSDESVAYEVAVEAISQAVAVVTPLVDQAISNNDTARVELLNDAGNWRWPAASTQQAINTERHRPWTVEETRTFNATVTKLADAMGPEWHAELKDIARLAAPLAHPNVPPPRIDAPRQVHIPGLAAIKAAFEQDTRTALGALPQAPSTPAPGPAVPPQRNSPARGDEPAR